MKRVITSLFSALFVFALEAQNEPKKVYNEDVNPIEQIDQALVKAKQAGKPFSEMMKPIVSRYANSGEINFKVEDPPSLKLRRDKSDWLAEP